MKKTISRLLALALASALVLSGCSGSTGGSDANGETSSEANDSSETTEASADEITDLVIPKVATRELETFNILYSQLAADFENLCNLTDPLLEVDNHGALSPALAEEWGTEDGGLTWTFKLRDGV